MLKLVNKISINDKKKSKNLFQSPEFKITVNYDQPVNLPGKNFLKESRSVFLFHSQSDLIGSLIKLGDPLISG